MSEAQIPYYVHEAEMYRMERNNKRWFIAFMIVLFMLFATNLGWVIYESQFETVVVTQDNADGYNSYIGNDGDIINGTASD